MHFVLMPDSALPVGVLHKSNDIILQVLSCS
jgi:hypothetical protein